jgi:NAD(P)-dependent dehydrogenase (short-subunit alcohol dehydrogenase family)
VIIAREDVPRLKPAPDAYLLAAGRLGLDPRQCLAYENTDAGIAAAVAAGMDVVDVRERVWSIRRAEDRENTMDSVKRTPQGDLRGQVCLVTGGAHGIGWALARALAEHGARVQVADISAEHLAEAADHARAASQDIEFTRLDVADRAALEGWINQVHTRAGRIDVLVNNAAFIRWTDVEEMTVEEAERSMRVGYDAMVHAIKAVLPIMSAAGGGHIVNMGSSAGQVFVQGPSAAYAAAKAAIEGYSRILQMELRGSPITLTLVRPGVVAGTDFFTTHVPSSRLPRLADFLPAASPEQVAAAVLTGIRHRKSTVDFPGYLPLLYRSYALTPGVFRYFSRAWGPARRDFSAPTVSVVQKLLRAVGSNFVSVAAMATVTPSLDRVGFQNSVFWS